MECDLSEGDFSSSDLLVLGKSDTLSDFVLTMTDLQSKMSIFPVFSVFPVLTVRL